MIPNWKPAKGSWKKQRTREKNQEKRERKELRHRVWIRDDGRCRCCKRGGLKLKSDSLFDLAHAHEIEFRSQQGDPLDTRNVLILCNECHLRGIHHQMSAPREWISIVVVDEENGADNPDGIEFRKWAA